MEKINILNDSFYCTFSDEMLKKLSASGLIRRKKVSYKFFLNNREFKLECPMIKDPHHKNLVIWPAIKLPYRKYPVYVYLYASALYLSSNLSMRSVAAKVRKIFGLDKFSHSTLCRSLKRLFYTLTKNGTPSNPYGIMFQGHFFCVFNHFYVA